ncbi:hypothetical protein BCR35DRAFT_333180 [Leucosporidium creatinivorum]|uniref:F-box domain-containing protein n=1 Tax=Leucosporidium creatinivorum TaxID=106004 RepID=A0A1Y2EUY7_9BASI|nr:hypothetical protein BCR35DRAFT_333180 [Leucosporidium creatinivorum]
MHTNAVLESSLGAPHPLASAFSSPPFIHFIPLLLLVPLLPLTAMPLTAMPLTEAPSSALPLAVSEPTLRLPFDVLDLIIEKAVRLVETRTARHFCLIHKALLPPLNAGLWSNDALLRRTLLEAPHLGQHVLAVQLAVDFDEHFTEDNCAQIERSLNKIISACPNVKSLVIHDQGEIEAPDEVAAIVARSSWARNLRDLQVDYTGDGAVALLKQAVQLRTLAIGGSGEMDSLLNTPSLPFSLPFSLVDLDFQLYSPHIFVSITAHSLSTLTSLRLTTLVFPHLEVQQCFSAMVALRILHLDGFTSRDDPQFRSIASAISGLPNLEDLTLVMGRRVQLGDPTHPLATALLPRLPLSLQRLDLSHIPIHPALLIRLFNFRNITPPPSLRKIVLPGAVSKALDGTVAEDLMWWSTVIECCAVNGVEALVLCE